MEREATEREVASSPAVNAPQRHLKMLSLPTDRTSTVGLRGAETLITHCTTHHLPLTTRHSYLITRDERRAEPLCKSCHKQGSPAPLAPRTLHFAVRVDLLFLSTLTSLHSTLVHRARAA